MPVTEPFEFFEAEEGREYTWVILRIEAGRTTIAPRFEGAPEHKGVEVLRVHLAPGVKETYPPFWDVTSKHLIAMLRGYLTEIPAEGKRVHFRWIGSGVRGRPALLPAT